VDNYSDVIQIAVVSPGVRRFVAGCTIVLLHFDYIMMQQVVTILQASPG